MCPVCKITNKTLYDDYDRNTGEFFTFSVAEPMYQRSYPGKKGYISPRCIVCYGKAEKKLLRKTGE